MPEEQQQGQQQPQGVAMPGVNPNMLAADDYVYEMKPPEDKKKESSATGSGGMGSQFEIVSSPLNRNN